MAMDPRSATSIRDDTILFDSIQCIIEECPHRARVEYAL